jgi:hypothetical protein
MPPVTPNPSRQGKFLRHIESGCWLGKDGSLVRELEGAREFKSTLEALDLYKQSGLRGMELVIKFTDSTFDVSLPMDNAA